MRVVPLLFSLLLSASGVMAQASADRTAVPSVRVTGRATVTARPDQAQVELGVVSEAATARDAAAQNAQRLDAVIAALRKALDQGTTIETVSYSLSPSYRYPQEGGQPTLTGYTATNVVGVKTAKLEDVGTVIDTALGAGANTVHRLLFTLKDEQPLQTQALRDAALRARAQADALASALGLKPGRVLSLAEETLPVVRPMYDRAVSMQAESRAAPTPVEPGMIEVHAVVILTVEIIQ